MFRLFATLTAAFLLSGFQVAPVPILPAPLAALADDNRAAREFDYFSLKTEGRDLKALGETTGEWIRQRVGSDTNWVGGRCMTAAEMELRAGIDAARIAPDAATFEADRDAAHDALNRWQVFAVNIQNGAQPTEQPFQSVAQWISEAEEATDPRAREVLGRVAKDQLYRHAYTSGRQVWGEGLSEGAMSRVHAFIAREICEIDKSNTAWLKSNVAAHGWFRSSVEGERASRGAWLIAQHADNEPAFQREVLLLLEPLVGAGETSGSNYAYLYDRVAVGSNRPQRYGTQGRCVAKDVWSPNDLEDPDRVEALRAEIGIGSLAEYQAHMHRYCAEFTG